MSININRFSKIMVTERTEKTVHLHTEFVRHNSWKNMDETIVNEVDGIIDQSMQLKAGYALVCTYGDGQLCGDGGRTHWVLIDPSDKVIALFESCHCGRGCGNGDCVRDDWGRHDCEPEIEAVRID